MLETHPKDSFRQTALRFLATCAVCLTSLIPVPALGGPEEDLQHAPWKIDADTLEYTESPAGVKASGNVILTPITEDRANPIIIKADEIEYFINQGRVIAKGHVELKTEEDRINAEKGEVFLETRTGLFENATVFHGKNNVYISGQLIEKTGDLTYHLRKGRITTCDTDSPDTSPTWSFGTGDTTVTKQGYAYIKHATFWIKKMPLLYSPILVIPAKTERQSGLLFPEFSNSERDGQGMLLPLFLNISPSRDATLYLGGLSKRGPMISAEYRYVSDLESRGIFAATYMHDTHEDTLQDNFNEDKFLRTEKNRYWLRGKADHYFDNGAIGRIDIDLVSDRDYLQEFQGSMVGFTKDNMDFRTSFNRTFQGMTQDYRENTAQLTKNWTNIGLYGELRGVDDVQNVTKPETPLWSLPKLAFSGLYPIFGLPADLSWESEYVYYYRNRGLGGHRFDVSPRLTIPLLPLGPLFEATVSSSIRETIYRVEDREDTVWPLESSQSRTLFDITADLATTLRRDFILGDVAEGRFVSHAIRPYGRYMFVPTADQTNLPVYDQEDRVVAANKVTYGLTNSFRYHSKEEDGTSTSREYAYLNVYQSYDDRTTMAEKYSDLFGEVEFNPAKSLQLKYETTVNLYGEGVTYYNFKASYISEKNNSIFTNYRYNKEFKVHEIHAGALIHLTNTLTVRSNISHSFNSTVGLVTGSASLFYQPSCWGVELSASKTSEDTRLMLSFSLSGIGNALELGRVFEQ